MAVCPKCGFTGEDNDQCERCGIVYARMHTMLEVHPHLVAQLSGKSPAIPLKPKRESTTTESPSIVVGGDLKTSSLPQSAIAQAFPGAQSGAQSRAPAPAPAPAMSRAPLPPEATPRLSGRTPVSVSRPGGGHTQPLRELTMVPMVPRAEAPSRLPWLFGVLVLCLLGWGYSAWRNAQRYGNAAANAAAVEEDADYYDLAVGSLVTDTRAQLKQVTNPSSARKQRDELLGRERMLRVQLATAPMTSAHRSALDAVLDDVARYLKGPVSAAIAAREASGTVLAGVAVAPPAGGATTVPPAAVSVPPTSVKPAIAPGAAQAATPSAVLPAGKVDLTLLNHATSALASLPP